MRPQLVQVSTSPRLYVVERFATSKEIAHILAVGADEKALIRRDIELHRTVAGFSFEMPLRGDRVVTGVARRIYRVARMVNDFGPTMRFRRYGRGEYHPPHLDAYAASGLVLVLTAMLYLTDTRSGGETSFPRARPNPVTIAPRKGRLVLWFNYRPNGRRDPRSWHESLPIKEGKKATLTNFLYKPKAFADTALRATRRLKGDWDGSELLVDDAGWCEPHQQIGDRR